MVALIINFSYWKKLYSIFQTVFDVATGNFILSNKFQFTVLIHSIGFSNCP